MAKEPIRNKLIDGIVKGLSFAEKALGGARTPGQRPSKDQVAIQPQVGYNYRPVGAVPIVPQLPTKTGEPIGLQTPIQKERYTRTGTKAFAGFIAEDYLAIMQGRNAIEKFDEMYRSDSQVYSAIRRGNKKLKNCDMYVDPVDDKNAEEVKIAEALEYNLFSGCCMKKIWRDYMNEILSFRRYGIAPFEPTFAVDESKKFGTLWVIKDLGWINPKTVWQIYVANDYVWSFRQISVGDDYSYVDAPGEGLLIFTYDLEGNNLWGLSPLRPMYASYLFKDLYRQINAMGAENNARGAWVAETPEDKIGGKAATRRAESLDNFTKGTVPWIENIKGWLLDFKKIDYQADAILKSMHMEDANISKTVQAEHQELGLNDVGAKAMNSSKEESEDASLVDDMKYICEKLQPLVKWFVIKNFGERDEYPTIKFNGLQSKPSLEFANTVAALTTAGYMSPKNPGQREYVLNNFEVPHSDSDIVEQAPAPGKGPEGSGPTPGQVKDGADAGKGADKADGEVKKEESEHGDMIKRIEADTKAGKEKPVMEYAKEIATVHAKKTMAEHKPGCTCGQDHETVQRLLEAGKIYAEYERNGKKVKAFTDTPRQLTEYEKKVDFAEMEKRFDTLKTSYLQTVRGRLTGSLTKYLEDLRAGLEKATTPEARRAMLSTVTVKGQGGLASDLKAFLIDATKEARNKAAEELNKGIKTFADNPAPLVSELPPGMYGWLASDAQDLAESQIANFNKKVKYATITKLKNEVEPDDELLIGAAKEAGEAYMDDDAAMGGGIAPIEAAAEGRWSLFMDFKDGIQGFQFSALMENTCPLCQALDGQTVSMDDPESEPMMPPLHHQCLLPGNDVLIPDLVAGVKGTYVGGAVKMRFADGGELTVTENHPIATPQGWVAAKFLNEGMDVLCCSDSQGMVKAVNPDNNHSTVKIEKIFDAFKKSSSVTSTCMKPTAENFHGDGGNLDGKVDVVYSESLLRRYGQTQVIKPSAELGFRKRKAVWSLLAATGRKLELLFGPFSAFDRLVGSACDELALTTGHVCHTDSLRLGSVTLSNTETVKATNNGLSYMASNLSNFLNRFASIVKTQKVLSVERFKYSGHVYDLQSGFNQLYLTAPSKVNSNMVIVSNCQCILVPILMDEETPALWTGLNVDDETANKYKKLMEVYK